MWGFTGGGFGSDKGGPCPRVVLRGSGKPCKVALSGPRPLCPSGEPRWTQGSDCASRLPAEENLSSATAVLAPSGRMPPGQREPQGHCLGPKVFLYSLCKRIKGSLLLLSRFWFWFLCFSHLVEDQSKNFQRSHELPGAGCMVRSTTWCLGERGASLHRGLLSSHSTARTGCCY